MSKPFTDAWVDGPLSTKFYARTYEATPRAKAHVVFVHGFAEHVGRYEETFPGYASKGISVFAYDQRGFGRTACDDVNKSTASSWGVTSWKDQQNDIAFYILRERERLGPSLPIFLMGHSMGGAEVLGSAVTPPTSAEALKQLTGIISCSPLIRQTSPASKLQLWLGDKAAKLLPNKLIPAPVNADDLSHDPVANKAYLDDPMIKASGTLRGLGDMLIQGIALAERHYKNWPSGLPVLIVHGDADKVTSHKASENFYTGINAKDKHISIYPGGYHELAHEPEHKARLTDEISDWILKRIPATTEEAKL